MANKYPLQAGDIAPDFSERETSPAADRRDQHAAPVSSYEGDQDAPSLTSSVAPLWKCGQVAPTSKNTPPFEPVHMEGDTSGDGTTIHSIDIYSYGDCYDPKSPTRVREVGSEWSVDTDFDGPVN